MSGRRAVADPCVAVNKPLYFGCWAETGHYLRNADGTHAAGDYRLLDGPYCPHEQGRYASSLDKRQPQGLARLTLEDDRTVLSFWDRTVDRRGGSHSTFLLPPGSYFEEAVAAARASFPSIWTRLDRAGVVVRCAEVLERRVG